MPGERHHSHARQARAAPAHSSEHLPRVDGLGEVATQVPSAQRTSLRRKYLSLHCPLLNESIPDIGLFFSCFQIAQFDLTPGVATKQLLLLPCFTGACQA